MADGRARVCRRERCTAGVGEQIEYVDRAACVTDHLVDKIPVGSLLGEQTGMLEAHRLELERQIAVVDGPLLGQLADFPLAAACVRAMVDGVRLVPNLTVLVARPDSLRVGALQNLIAPSFNFFTAAAVEHGVVLPMICDPHKYSPLHYI